MIKQQSAQIYTSTSRGETTLVMKFKRFSTFNFNEYRADSRESFGTIEVINEEILAPSQETTTDLKSNIELLLIPLFGTIQYNDHLNDSHFIKIGQILHATAQKEYSYSIANAYSKYNISYLQIWLKSENSISKTTLTTLAFDSNPKNELTLIYKSQNTIGFIGVFNGRKDGCYSLKNKNNGAFVYVISGAFEVENRLLETNDGLGLKETEVIEWEALSENAVLMLFEVPL